MSEDRTVRSFCRFCEALCGIDVTVREDQVLSVRGVAEDPLSHGYTCPKGRALPSWHHSSSRLDVPQTRHNGDLADTSWESCLGDLADRLADIMQRHGPDAIGVYVATGVAFDANGRRTAERFRQALGTKSFYSANSIDTPAKMLVSELMSGHPGLVPVPDREEGSLFLFFGTNPVVSHGHLHAFPDPVTTIRRLVERGEVWVIDPRKTETAKLATHHLPIRPGTDYAVAAFLVRALLQEGANRAYLNDHGDQLDTLEEAVHPFTLEEAAARSAVNESGLMNLLESVRRHQTLTVQTGTGLTMSAAANVSEWLIWTLQAVTGSFEQAGGTWFHPGYLKRLDTRPFEPASLAPGPGPDSRPDVPGRWGEIPCAAMVDEIEAGNLRALIVCGGNPITAFPDTERTAKALEQLEVLAVADVVTTETTRLASHILPVAGQLERADLPLYIDQFMPAVATRYTEAVVPPAAERRPLWRALADLAMRLGYSALPDGVDVDGTDDDLLAIVGDRSTGTFAQIREQRVVIDRPRPTAWVHNHVLPGGKWRLAPKPLVQQLATLETPPDLVLIPHRQVRHLNSMLTTDGAGGKLDLPDLFIHPQDAATRLLNDAAEADVSSDTGTVRARVRLDPDIRQGSATIPHGFSDPNVSKLTTTRRDTDPLTGMVLQSGIAITVVPA